jgi:hypothetical protein
MNDTIDSDELKDEKAKRREEKKRKEKQRIKQHGRDLKKPTDRTASHISKVEKRKNKER